MDYVEKNKELWQEHFKNVSLDYPNEEVVRFLAKCRKDYPNGIMIDWGCATGRHTILGCKFGFKVIAVDYVKHCIELTRNKVEKTEGLSGEVIKYIVNDNIEVNSIEDNSVDFILAWGCMFYNKPQKIEEMLTNMNKMLKKGGRIFCDFRTERDSMCNEQGQKIEEDVYLIADTSTSLSGLQITILPLEKLKNIIRQAGFEIKELELYEFTQKNMSIRNSWWHIEIIKG